jgi:exonuclease III
MILLSLNIRGIGGSLKAAAFRRVLDTTLPNIIFLQETMVTDIQARSFAFRFRPSWDICAVNAVGTSGGLLVMWDPHFLV